MCTTIADKVFDVTSIHSESVFDPKSQHTHATRGQFCF